jgi:hypothetical protein
MLQKPGNLSGVPSTGTPAKAPLRRAHSHNDYTRSRPLLDALEHRFTSIEADIHLLDGQLKVGHTAAEARNGKTLEELYLEPLDALIEKNGGQVFDDGTPLTLLIDVKTSGPETYQALHRTLATYSHILTEYEKGKIQSDPVRVVLSGNVARAEVEAEDHRYLAIDGRIEDLRNRSEPDLVPMISQSWQEHFLWHGVVPMPKKEREKLRAMVSEAHQQGKQIRFWGTPDRTDVWKEELAAGVDLLQADNLPRLEAFLRDHQGLSQA